MPMGHRDSLLHHLRRAVLHAAGERRTDGQLLEHFIAQRDETAFEALLRRHGPMVRSVCRRILGDLHDADDAFQATFLVLVRRAASVRPREAVGNFLYGVAYRTALEARRRMARRRAREMPLQNVPQPESEPGDLWQELRPLLDREVSRLSEKYRLPVVLCELEGRSRKEVARQLAIPEGTLSSRLATARKKLAARLARYGLAFSGASLAALLAENTASACVPAALSGATVKAAMLVAVGPAAIGVVSTTVTTLTEGVLKAMFVAKIKTATVVLFGVAALGLGTGGVVYQTRVGAADPQKRERGAQERPGPTREAEPEKDKWRKIAEEAQAREKELRAELDKLQREVLLLRHKVRESHQALESTQRRRVDAPPNEQRETPRPERRNPSQPETNRKVDRPRPEADRKVDRPSPDPNWALLGDLEAKRASLLAEFEKRLQALAAEQKALQEKMQVELAEFDKMKDELLKRQAANQPNPKAVRPPHLVTSDKLDQILQRLERLEKRLDRLEGSKPERSGP
ncbi:MAG TPA: sigma-70 family RNA polymerase sigma factor [Gemmataceae bacterium]|jgi:RNA polymerase sigma factor (sigma-70 family)